MAGYPQAASIPTIASQAVGQPFQQPATQLQRTIQPGFGPAHHELDNGQVALLNRQGERGFSRLVFEVDHCIFRQECHHRMVLLFDGFCEGCFPIFIVLIVREAGEQ